MPKCVPVGLDFVERARIVVSVDVSLTATPAQVWTVLNDNDGWPRWFDGMKTCRVTSSLRKRLAAAWSSSLSNIDREAAR